MNRFKMFILRYKDSILRFFLSFSVISCICFSCFEVGALQSVWFACDKPQVTDNTGYVEVVCSQGRFVFNLFHNTNNNPSFYVEQDENGYLKFRCGNLDTNDSCYSFYCGQDGKPVVTPFENSYSYFRAYNIYMINGYNVDVVNVQVSTPSEPYSFYYSGDVILADKMNVISSVLSSIQSTISNESSLTRDKLNEILTYIIYCNSNLEQVEETLNSVLDSTNSIDSKLDKVLQILQAAENGSYYNPADDGTSSTVTNQQQKDDEVMQGTSIGRTEANNAISGFSGLLTTTGSVFKGSLALTKVFNLFAQSSFLAPILQISLVLGIASFVLGTSVLSLGHFAHNAKPSRGNKKNKNDEE